MTGQWRPTLQEPTNTHSMPLILIVDHDAVEASNIREALEQKGFTCALAGSGAEVIAFFDRQRPDLMVVESTLPDMMAEELAAKLGRSTFLPPYIVIASQDDTNRAVALVKNGAGDFLARDECLLEQLPAAVTHVLEEDRVKRKLAEMERSFRESEARFRSLAENTSDLLIRFDRTLRHIYLNPAAERFYGRPASELVGLTLDESGLPQTLITAWKEALTQVISDGKAQSRQWDQDGVHGSNHYDLRLIPEFDVLERVSTILVTGRDITRLKSLEEQLYHARKLESIGTLAGVVAHDLNNLLTPILGYATILKRDFPADHPLAKGTTVIEKAAERAAGLLGRLLVFARQVKHLSVPVELPVLIDDLMTGLRPKTDGKVELVVSISPGLPPALGDPLQLAQVLQHLASNAIDAMPDGGKLVVTLDMVTLDMEFCRHHPTVAPGPHLCLTIADTGSGISDEIRERIFEPFFSTKGVAPGRGLGLALVYSIIKSHTGTIVVESAAGEGTTIKVYLPIAHPAPASPV